MTILAAGRISRRIGSCAAALLLAGCAQTTYGQYFHLIRQNFLNSFHSQSVTREQAAAIAYASIGYRVDGGSEQILILATDSGGSQIWTSAAHVVLQMRDGRVLHSVGLPRNLDALLPQRAPSLPSPAAALKAPYRSDRLADFNDTGAYAVPITCTSSSKGPQATVILGASIATIRVDEACTSSAGDWSFTDSYWVEPQSGMVWKSVQHLHPKGPTVEVEILRPPG